MNTVHQRPNGTTVVIVYPQVRRLVVPQTALYFPLPSHSEAPPPASLQTREVKPTRSWGSSFTSLSGSIKSCLGSCFRCGASQRGTVVAHAEVDTTSALREECQRLETFTSNIDVWVNQIHAFVKSDRELKDQFEATLAMHSDSVVRTTVPLLEVDLNNLQDREYFLKRKLDNSKRQFRELIRFVASYDDLWNCFIKSTMRDVQSEVKDLKTLFNIIFDVLRNTTNENIKKLFRDQIAELETNSRLDHHLIRVVFLQLSNDVIAFQQFSDLMVKHVLSQPQGLSPILDG